VTLAPSAQERNLKPHERKHLRHYIITRLVKEHHYSYVAAAALYQKREKEIIDLYENPPQGKWVKLVK